jgi:hypothetical protein
MTEEVAAIVAKHQTALETLLVELPTPDLVTLSDKDGNHLNGNQSGYLQLAVACLTAAQGRGVILWSETWLRDDMWTFASLSVDPSPRKRERFDRSYRSAGCLVLTAITLALLLVGLITVVGGIYHWAVTPIR